MLKITIPIRGLARIMRPAKSRLAICFQPVRRLGRVITSSQAWINYNGFDTGFPTFAQPVRGVVNRPLRLKKIPTDYPLLTGSEHWRRKVRTVFQRLDVNADGYFTKEDMVTSAQTLIDYLDLSGESAESVLNSRLEVWAFLAGDRPRISEDEHRQYNLSVLNERYFRQEFYKTFICTEFNVLDIDGDGFISKKEHAAFYYSFNTPTECSNDNFDMMDTDGDGLVSIDEFAESILEFWLTEDPNNIYNQTYGPLVDLSE